MADFSLYYPKLLDLEGRKFETVPGDNGGCTKYGIILDDMKEFFQAPDLTCEDVEALDEVTAAKMTKEMYWDYFHADDIRNQSLAEFIVDGGFNQGRRLIAKYVQFIVGVSNDGVVGEFTLQAINDAFSKDVFSALKDRRTKRYTAIVDSNPKQKKFLKGWFNRLNSFEYNA
jgi:lysozyme family protein